jgi:hypothetical protein
MPAIACALLAASCATAPPGSINIENVQTVPAMVQSVDLTRRLVSLRTQDGRTAIVEVGPEAPNLDRVRPGSSAMVRYYLSLAAQLKTKGASTTPHKVSAADAAAQSNGTQRGGNTRTTTVLIDSVDQRLNTVTFKKSSGALRTVAVQTPAGQEFIERLKKGDEVELTLTESFAFSVVPAT